MEIRKGQKVKVICTEARLKEVGVKQKHIKHILGKILRDYVNIRTYLGTVQFSWFVNDDPCFAGSRLAVY